MKWIEICQRCLEQLDDATGRQSRLFDEIARNHDRRMRLNSDEPLDAAYPYVESLDGIALQRWLEIAMQQVPHGSPQLRQRWAIERLEAYDVFREALNVIRQQAINVTLRNADGQSHVQKKLRLTKQGFSIASVRLKSSRMFDGNIGYLRIPAMEDRIAESLVAKVREFRGTDGLVIDVRDNGGGTYGILRRLYPFFRTADAGPYVTANAGGFHT